MKIRTSLAVFTAKALTFLLRLTGRGGTALPGKAAMILQRHLLTILSRNVRVIMITGTNGKTTTSRITSRILEEAGLSFFENKSGANLLSGITASFAMNSSISGRCTFDFAVIECDEAAFRTVCPMVEPEVVIVTNLFRDQLDRFGEITHTRNNIISGLVPVPGATVVLNADDSLSYSIKDHIANDIILYGLSGAPYGDDSDFLSDAPYCIKCKSPYSYEFRTYGHLGKFMCPNCGYKREEPDILASDFKLHTETSEILLSVNGESSDAVIALPGAYNIYNAISAASAATVLKIKLDMIVRALSEFQSGFGRMEKLELDGVDLHMILVKNPAGLNQVINFLSSDNVRKTLVLILNDNFADGTDISWIWDVNFEKIPMLSESIDNIIVSGVRAEELMLRLKYAGADTGNISIDKNYDSVIDRIIPMNDENLPVYILPTYTAMFDFRKALSKRFKIREFWK